LDFERWLHVLPLRWRSLTGARQLDRDLDDEIAYHLEQQVGELVAKGVARDEAWRAVRRSFGGVERAKEQCRDARGMSTIDAVRQDVGYALRTLRRAPGFTAVATLTLALGIGATTAVYSLIDVVLLSHLPYAAPDQLVSITGPYPNGAFAAMRNELETMDVGAYADGQFFTLTGRRTPVRLAGARVSAELFSILGVAPAMGRWLHAGEDASPNDRFAILSHGAWLTRFGSDPHIVGTSIELDGQPHEIVAVMPASFEFASRQTEVWVPLGLDPRNTVRHWAGDFMPVVGRLRPGASLADAHAEIRLFQSRIVARFPWQMPADWNKDVSAIPLHEALVGDVKTRFLIMLAAVAAVLVIACANVANLTLSRSASRRREIGIRTALGAAPRRVAQQLLTESVVLALLGAIAGVLVAAEGLSILKVVLPPDTPRLMEAHVSWRALLFAGGLAILTGCSFGLAPVAQAVRARLDGAFDSGSRGSVGTVAAPLRAALTVAQVACAVLLLIAAGLLVRSLWTLSQSDPGFHADQVVTARISPAESICDTADRCLTFYRELERQVQAAPGVRGAALVNTLPLTGEVAKRSVVLEGYTVPAGKAAPLFWLHAVTPDYFKVMDIRLEAGRAFTRADLSGRPAVAMVTSATARRFWPGQDPIGRQVRFVNERNSHTVVGVVADVRGFDLARSVPEWIDGVLYVPHGPNATMEDGRIPSAMGVVINTSIDSRHTASMLEGITSQASGPVVVDAVRAMTAITADAVAAPAATTLVLVTVAALALALGCIGVYGVLSFLVSRQTREIGIRLALGARPSDVFWLVIREGAALCATGIVIGIGGAFAATRWLASELHGVNPTDPVTYAAVAAAVALVSLCACAVPTRRAMRVDPLIVLREP
jgi:putative ABC transport system permease protein